LLILRYLAKDDRMEFQVGDPTRIGVNEYPDADARRQEVAAHKAMTDEKYRAVIQLAREGRSGGG